VFVRVLVCCPHKNMAGKRPGPAQTLVPQVARLFVLLCLMTTAVSGQNNCTDVQSCSDCVDLASGGAGTACVWCANSDGGGNCRVYPSGIDISPCPGTGRVATQQPTGCDCLSQRPKTAEDYSESGTENENLDSWCSACLNEKCGFCGSGDWIGCLPTGTDDVCDESSQVRGPDAEATCRATFPPSCWGTSSIGITVTLIGTFTCTFLVTFHACCKDHKCHLISVRGAFVTHCFDWAIFPCYICSIALIAVAFAGGEPEGWGFVFVSLIVASLFCFGSLALFCVARYTGKPIWRQYWNRTGTGSATASDGTHVTIDMGYYYWVQEEVDNWWIAKMLCAWGIPVILLIIAVPAYWANNCG
jgi:hypothetical protein